MKKILEISVDSVIENLNNEEKKYIIDKLLSYPQAYANRYLRLCLYWHAPTHQKPLLWVHYF